MNLQEPDAPAKPTDDTALLKELRDRLELCIGVEGDNRDKALSDLKFLSGEQWDDRARILRESEGRPCLTINKLPAFIHQVTNDQRQNRAGIKVHAVSDGADQETAEVLQGLIRHIEYASNADVAYDTAVNSAAQIGFGFFRVVTEYCRQDSFDQEIRIKRIRNPFTVYIDPASEEVDGSDMRFAILSVEIPKDEFRFQYPDADLATLEQHGTGDSNARWMSKDMVRVAEYYRIESKMATLIRLSNGETGWKSDLLEMPPGVTIVKTRQAERKQIRWYKCTGTEVLEQADIPCDWVPVFPVYGDELDIEGTVIRSGMVRHAKDPCKQYNYFMTTATEEVSLRPKTPYIGAEGQFEGHEDEWAEANVRSFPYLEYKPTTVDGTQAPPPQRQPMADVPVGVLQMAMHAADNIKATTGIFDASLGAQGNETSGRAILARQKEGDSSNFHYADNLNITLRHVGRCLLSMIPKVYDTERVVRILGEDEQPKHAVLNQQLPTPKVDPDTGTIQTVLNDVTVGEYDVTVTSGPSYTTMRQEAAEAMMQFGQSWPKLMDIAGDKVVRAMDWPGADDIADRIEKTIPPNLLETDESQAGMVMTPQGPIPPEQATQVMQQMKQHIDQMQQQLQDAQAGLDKAEIAAAAQIHVANINRESRNDVEEIKGLIAMLIERMQPPPYLAQASGAAMGESVAPDENPPDPSQQTQQPPPGGFFTPEGSQS